MTSPVDYLSNPAKRDTETDLVVYGADGKIVNRSRNLAGIYRYARTHSVAFVTIQKEEDGRGSLKIVFDNGSIFHTLYADYSVMIEYVSRWRSLQGVQLVVRDWNNKPIPDTGIVEPSNPWLRSGGRTT